MKKITVQENSLADYLENLKDEKKHLILGNGFSTSLFSNIFNYAKLQEGIKKDDSLKDIFEKFSTYDYEYIMRKILDTKDVLNVLKYDNIQEIKTDLEEKYEKLKSYLIETIANLHPENPNAIKDEQYDSAISFLEKFNKIYTFNYDLILYWTLLKRMEKNSTFQCNDGFGYDDNHNETLTWSIGREHEQNLYYLHGALHLFQDRTSLEKYKWQSSKNLTIKEQVTGSIENNKLPLFIAEGSKEQKQSRIQQNGYLSRTFASLKGISQSGGYIFIFGHSLRDEDDYVFEHIFNSKKSYKKPLNLYIGYYSEEDKSNITTKCERWDTKYKDKNIKFHMYLTKEMNVWNAENNYQTKKI